jgi:hypothetical protein
VKQFALRFYRWWRALNHQGLTQDTWNGLDKFQRAKAVGLLVALAPMIPLMVSDQMGFERGWLYNAWSLFAGVWLTGVFGTILYQTGRSLTGYLKARHDRSR